MTTTRWRWLPALFLLLPVVELLGIVFVARQIGWWPTFGLLAALSLCGMVLVRRAGRRAWTAFAKSAERGQKPSEAVSDSVMGLLGGLLLIPPGFVKDILALVLVLPFTRPLVRRWIQAWAVSKGSMYVSTRVAQAGTVPDSRHGPTSSPYGPDVVRGEVLDD